MVIIFNRKNSLINQFVFPFIFIGFFFLSSCGKDCSELPSSYSSYDDAISEVKSAHFALEESIETDESTWIKGASYFSCDSKTGYFILNTDSKEYIYGGVPIGVWYNFKNAKSFGGYYNDYIKHHFYFKLNKQ